MFPRLHCRSMKTQMPIIKLAAPTYQSARCTAAPGIVFNFFTFGAISLCSFRLFKQLIFICSMVSLTRFPGFGCQ